jgi:hypothetical protein
MGEAMSDDSVERGSRRSGGCLVTCGNASANLHVLVKRAVLDPFGYHVG